MRRRKKRTQVMADHGFQFTPPDPELKLTRSDLRKSWVTLCVHTFKCGDNGNSFRLTVPEGFRCDLASVPTRLLPLCGPSALYQRAALFHDGGYFYQPVAYRSIIDEFFRVMLLHDGVKPWRAWLMWAAVRLFGGKAWKENAKCNADCVLDTEDS